MFFQTYRFSLGFGLWTTCCCSTGTIHNFDGRQAAIAINVLKRAISVEISSKGEDAGVSLDKDELLGNLQAVTKDVFLFLPGPDKVVHLPQCNLWLRLLANRQTHSSYHRITITGLHVLLELTTSLTSFKTFKSRASQTVKRHRRFLYTCTCLRALFKIQFKVKQINKIRVDSLDYKKSNKK